MSPPGTMFSRTQNTRTEFHIPLRRLATRSSQGHSTELVLSSERDAEKGLDNYGPFDSDLRLTLSNEANKATGIQPKQVGVTWEDLQVVVHEDKDRKVRSFSWEFYRSSYISIRHTSRHLTVGSFVCSWAIRN